MKWQMNDFEIWLLTQKDREDEIGCLGQDINYILKYPHIFKFHGNDERYSLKNMRLNNYGCNAQLALIKAQKEFEEMKKDQI